VNWLCKQTDSSRLYWSCIKLGIIYRFNKYEWDDCLKMAYTMQNCLHKALERVTLTGAQGTVQMYESSSIRIECMV